MKKLFITVVALLSICLSSFCQSGRAIIRGKFDHLKNGDSVQVVLYEYGEFPYSAKELRSAYTAVVRDKAFKLDIPLSADHPYECMLEIPRHRCPLHLHSLILEKGDDVYVSGDDCKVSDFEGKGAGRLNIINKLIDVLTDPAYINKSFPSHAADFPEGIRSQQKTIARGNAYLDSQKNNLSEKSYALLRFRVDDYVSGIFYSLMSNLRHNDTVKNALKTYWLPYRNSYHFQESPEAALYSSLFTSRVINDYKIEHVALDKHYLSLSDSGGLKAEYLFFKDHYSGAIREKLVTYLILSEAHAVDIQYCYEDAIKYIKKGVFRAGLDMHCQNTPGMPAYPFSLPDSNHVAHHLSDYKGKVIVFDFWFTGCGNCVRLTPKLKIVEDHFSGNKDVVFISVSSDEDLNMWKKSIRSGLYTTGGNEINLYTGGQGSSHIFLQKINFQGAPTLRVIGKAGKWCGEPVDCRRDDGKALIAEIEAALKG